MLTATRENLRMGASQIKLMAGGGTSSAYDPIDVTQYTSDEMKAAIEAADDWNTYVAVHAYTPRAVRRAQRGIWLSAQNLIPDSPNMTPERRKKRAGILEGNTRLWPMAKNTASNLRGAPILCSSRN
ncbi:hypothetical protein HNQ36_000655 [Afipia massiliensis]|uniref:Amidohydrolase-related domain-containing protein n=1 Tax=Afipia massiliensis TaxID=211460 RepID=A0A840MWZ5_9BRAD|nr:hypothetical protein [Afipia massiliensis]